MASRIVLFGATGYTGDLTARALVARGHRPVLAARNPHRVVALAEELGGLETGVADVAQPASIQALLEPGDVLISTVGPFARWGEAAVTSAISQQGYGFADQVVGEVGERSRRADVWLERAARRMLHRTPPAPQPGGP